MRLGNRKLCPMLASSETRRDRLVDADSALIRRVGNLCNRSRQNSSRHQPSVIAPALHQVDTSPTRSGLPELDTACMEKKSKSEKRASPRLRATDGLASWVETPLSQSICTGWDRAARMGSAQHVGKGCLQWYLQRTPSKTPVSRKKTRWSCAPGR